MCSGWGGRLLGSLSSQLKIHYVGTDVNSNNKGCYESLETSIMIIVMEQILLKCLILVVK